MPARIALCVLGLVGALSITYVVGVQPQVRTLLMAEEQERLNGLAQWTAAAVTDDLDKALAELDAAGEAIGDPRQVPPMVLDRRVARLEAVSPFWRTFTVMDADGIVVARPSKPERTGEDRSHKEYFAETVRTDGTHLAEPFTSTSDNLSLAAGTPLHTADGQITGVLAGSLGLADRNAEFFDHVLRPGSAGVTRIVLLSRDGVILADSADPGLDHLEGLATQPLPSEKVSTYDRDGVATYGVSARLPSPGWTVIVEEPTAVLDARVRDAAEPIGALFAVALLLLLAVGYLAGRWLIGRPFMGMAAERDAVEQRFRSLFDGLPVGLYRTTPDGRILDANPALVKTHGCRDLADLLSRSSQSFYVDEHAREEFLALMERDGVVTGFETRFRKADGLVIWVHISGRAERGPDGSIHTLEGAVVDVTERKRAETALAHQALHDPLTGLANRTLLVDRLAHALDRHRRTPERVALLFCDLDRFKVINDSLGHDVGDDLLITVGRRLREAVRPGDTVARLGGDEFVILCEGVRDAEEATWIANRAAHVVSSAWMVHDRAVVVTVSTGIALSSDDGGAEDLLAEADAAMYRAKSAGRARHVLFDTTMRTEAVRRLETEAALRHALEARELFVAYQPEIDLRSGRVVGVEALVRWDRPGHGLVSPADFLPVAEEAGLDAEVDVYVLAEACRQLAVWRSEHPGKALPGGEAPLVVWTNLSARALGDPDLPTTVQAILTASGVPAEALGLEITESSLMADTDAVVGALGALKALGVRLAVDDFGTGYSSLSYLKRFPVDVLKVDRSFVDGVVNDPDDAAIVRAVISMAHALGLVAVAEGVETAAQLYRLEDLGCDLAQGYLLGRPMPADGIDTLLTRRRPTPAPA